MKSKNKRRLLLLIVIGLLLFGIYVFLIEPNRLTVTYIGTSENPTAYPLESELRIAFFADLHMYKYREFHQRLLDEIEGYHPDIILFGGDALGKMTDVHDLELFFHNLEKIAPCYTNFGNWEEYAPVHMKQRFKNLGITFIDKETIYETIKDFKIGITGLESHYFLSQTTLIDKTQQHDLSILLIHSPIGLDNKKDVLESYDLVLSGHIHGGQYAIPFLTKKILDWRNGQDIEFYAGEYKEKETMIYVTRGVGQWFPGRFNCPPELVILDLMLPKD